MRDGKTAMAALKDAAESASFVGQLNEQMPMIAAKAWAQHPNNRANWNGHDHRYEPGVYGVCCRCGREKH